MKKISALLLLLICCCLSANFNVKKFGAKGDGRTDDTKAIQAAFTAAAKSARTANSYGKHPRSSYYGSGPMVVFPHGKYKISSTIKVGNFVNFSGANGIPMLTWAGEEKGVMFDISAFRTVVEKLIFTGSGVQLRFSNRNVDKTMITIRDCQFLYASDIAIKLEPAPKADHLSAQTLIEGCLFSKNFRCVQNYGDLMEFRNNWVDLAQPYMADGAAMINKYGTMRIAFSCMTPSANPDKGPLYYHNARWVDNYARFEAANVRFGGEGGGIPIVYNYSKAASTHPMTDGSSRVSIYNCLIAGGQAKRENGSVVRLFKLPTQLSIRDCYGIGAIPLILCDPSLDVAEALKKNRLDRVKYHVSGNILHNPQINAVPEELKKFFTQDSDCVFKKLVPRAIPKEITYPAKKK